MLKTNEINIRDPFVLPFEGRYYMYGSRGFEAYGFDVYVSTDLENWEGPTEVFKTCPAFWGTCDFWAPEVHLYNGKFYMFASSRSETQNRGTSILVADSPMGPFKPHSEGSITPKEWHSLDGTFYVEDDGTPYMVFCHEWTQIKNGTVEAVELSRDLRRPVGTPRTLFRASDGFWVTDFDPEGNYVTDGPYLIKVDGHLAVIWSSYACGGKYFDRYIEAVSYSDNGHISGNFTVSDHLLFEKDGGHGMIFKGFDGKYRFVYHSPNHPAKAERPYFIDISLSDFLKLNNA